MSLSRAKAEEESAILKDELQTTKSQVQELQNERRLVDIETSLKFCEKVQEVEKLKSKLVDMTRLSYVMTETSWDLEDELQQSRDESKKLTENMSAALTEIMELKEKNSQLMSALNEAMSKCEGYKSKFESVKDDLPLFEVGQTEKELRLQAKLIENPKSVRPCSSSTPRRILQEYNDIEMLEEETVDLEYAGFSRKPVNILLQLPPMEARRKEVNDILNSKIKECQDRGKVRFLAVEGSQGPVIFLHPVFRCHVLLKDQDLAQFNHIGAVSAVPMEDPKDIRLEFQYFFGVPNVYYRTKAQYARTLDPKDNPDPNCGNRCKSVLDNETRGNRLNVGAGREIVYGIGQTCLMSLKMSMNVLFPCLNQEKPPQPFISADTLNHLVSSTSTFMSRNPIDTEVTEAKQNWEKGEKAILNIVQLLTKGSDGQPPLQLTVDQLIQNTEPEFLQRVFDLFHKDSDVKLKNKEKIEFDNLCSALEKSNATAEEYPSMKTNVFCGQVVTNDVAVIFDKLVKKAGCTARIVKKRKPAYKCKHCPKLFTTTSSRRRHEARHYGIRFFCTQCAKSYSSKSNLDTHVLKHGTPKYKCTETDCTKMFFVKNLLLKHLLTHAKKEAKL